MPLYAGLASRTNYGFVTAAQATRLNDICVDVIADFGAKGDGATSDGTAINNAIQALAATGGIVFVPALNASGTVAQYIIDTTILMNVSGVWLLGGGHYGNADAGAAALTRGPQFIALTGGMTVIKATATASGGTGPALKSPHISDLNILGIGNAAIGLQIISAHFGTYERLYISNCTTAHLDANVLAAGSLGEAHDVTKNAFRDISIRAIENTGIGIRLDGSNTANPSECVFENISILHSTGKGVQLLNADSNKFMNLVVNRGAGGTGIGVEINGSNVGAINCGRNNMFYGGSAGVGGVSVLGTETTTFPALDNYWHDYEVGNGEPAPLIGVGTNFKFSVNGASNAIPQYSTLTGDRLLTNSNTTTQTFAVATTVTDITGLNLTLIHPGGSYQFDAMFNAIGSATTTSSTALTVAVNCPAGATLFADVVGAVNSTVVKSVFFTAVNAAQGGAGFATVNAYTAPIRISGKLVLGTATSQTGSIQIRAAMASGTASSIVQTCTIQNGAWIKAVRLA